MAKFCTNCGKKLKEGEVCNCAKKNVSTNTSTTDINGYLNKIWDVMQKMFKAPIDCVKEYTKEDNFIVSIILVIVSGISFGLFSLALIKNVYANVMDSMGYGLGSFMSMQTPEIPYFKCFLIVSLLSIGMYFLEALVLWLVCDKGFKVNIDYKKSLNVIAPISIYMTLASLLSIIGVYLAFWIVLILILVAGILRITTLTLSLKESVKVDQNKIGYAMIAILTIPTLVLYLLISLF